MLKKEAREYLEYGERLLDIKQISYSNGQCSNIKYPMDKGYRVAWVFDNSSCHNAYSEDALIAANMNAKPSGKQSHLRGTE